MLTHIIDWFRRPPRSGSGEKAPAVAPEPRSQGSPGSNGRIHFPVGSGPTPPPVSAAAPTGGSNPRSGAPPSPEGSGIAKQSEVLSIPWRSLVAGVGRETRPALSRIEGVETIDVPTVMLELALKRGRVAFCWRLICQWAKPQCAGANLQSLFPGDVTVELPLQVIAPLFLSRKSPPNGRTVDLPDEVPDLFAKPQAPLQQRAVLESAQTNPPPPRESQALTASVPQERRNDMSPQHQSRRCGNSLSLSPHHPVPSEEHSGGGKLPEHVNHPSAPSQPQAHGVAAGAGGRLCALRSAVAETEPIEDPKDLVRRARELPGVEGVALASPDGLLLASHLPSNLDREAVAAFLPRLFAQAFDFAWPFEVRPSDHVVYSFQEATIALLRVNGFLLAAAGPPSQTMPLGQLRHLARRMRPGAPAAR